MVTAVTELIFEYSTIISEESVQSGVDPREMKPTFLLEYEAVEDDKERGVAFP
jgi:hypothetical protein